MTYNFYLQRSYEDVKKLIEEVQNERDKLIRCKKHEFEIISFGRCKCLNCGCTVDGSFVYAYNQGYQHGLNEIK